MRYLLFLTLFLKLYGGFITPLPSHVQVNIQKAILGKALFFEPMLSKDNKISCASCHDVYHGGDDGKKVSIGVNGQKGNINTPSVLNAVFNFKEYWNGRAKTLKDQVYESIKNPFEMGNNFKNIVNKINHTSYKKWFQKVYGEDGVNSKNIIDAIVEYEKTLITPSRFDRFLKGDEKALTKTEKEGFLLFKTKGCIACHNGKNIGGNMYSKYGAILRTQDNNLGRYNVTKDERDKYVFKVPSLRNVALTAPYFHNGSISSLKQAVYFMSLTQTGRVMKEDEVDKIVSFLHSLTGNLIRGVK